MVGQQGQLSSRVADLDNAQSCALSSIFNVSIKLVCLLGLLIVIARIGNTKIPKCARNELGRRATRSRPSPFASRRVVASSVSST